MKRSLLLLSACLVGFSSLAQGAPKIRSSLYIGAQAGYSHMYGKMRGDFNPVVVGAPSSIQSSKSKHSDNVAGDILAGGRYIFRNGFALGGDVSFGLDNNKLSTPLNHPVLGFDSFFNNKIRMRYNVVPSIMIGKLFTPRLLGFFKLGVGFARFKHELFNISETADTGSLTKFKFSTTRIALVPTLGFEYQLLSRFSLVGTISHESYGRARKFYNDNIVPSSPQAETYVSSVKPRFFKVKAGVLFHF